MGVLLLGYITSFPELTHGLCLFCLHRMETASCQQLIFHLKESSNIGSPGRRGRDIRQVLPASLGSMVCSQGSLCEIDRQRQSQLGPTPT